MTTKRIAWVSKPVVKTARTKTAGRPTDATDAYIASFASTNPAVLASLPAFDDTVAPAIVPSTDTTVSFDTVFDPAVFAAVKRTEVATAKTRKTLVARPTVTYTGVTTPDYPNSTFTIRVYTETPAGMRKTATKKAIKNKVGLKVLTDAYIAAAETAHGKTVSAIFTPVMHTNTDTVEAVYPTTDVSARIAIRTPKAPTEVMTVVPTYIDDTIEFPFTRIGTNDAAADFIVSAI